MMWWGGFVTGVGAGFIVSGIIAGVWRWVALWRMSRQWVETCDGTGRPKALA
jgi:hypothetical protein